MNKLIYVITVFFLLPALTGSSLADEQNCLIGTFPVPMMVEDENRGIFIELFREIEKRTGKKFGLAVYPPARALKMFHNGSLAGYFPALDAVLEKDVYKTESFYIKRDFAFVRKDRPVISEIKQLEGKTVGLTLGYAYAPELVLNTKIRTDYATMDILGMKKLWAGRIDVFIAEEKSGLKVTEESAVSDYVYYDPNTPIYEHKMFFAFQKTEQGKYLADRFSEILINMKKDGSLEKIMSLASSEIRVP